MDWKLSKNGKYCIKMHKNCRFSSLLKQFLTDFHNFFFIWTLWTLVGTWNQWTFDKLTGNSQIIYINTSEFAPFNTTWISHASHRLTVLHRELSDIIIGRWRAVKIVTRRGYWEVITGIDNLSWNTLGVDWGQLSATTMLDKVTAHIL